MAFPDPLVLLNPLDIGRQFTRRNPIPNGNRYLWTNSSMPRTDHVDLRFIDQRARGNAVGSVKSIASFGLTRVDPETDNMVGGLASISLVRPKSDIITANDYEEIWSMLQDFLVASGGGYKQRFERGET